MRYKSFDDAVTAEKTFSMRPKEAVHTPPGSSRLTLVHNHVFEQMAIGRACSCSWEAGADMLRFHTFELRLRPRGIRTRGSENSFR